MQRVLRSHSGISNAVKGHNDIVTGPELNNFCSYIDQEWFKDAKLSHQTLLPRVCRQLLSAEFQDIVCIVGEK